MPLDQPQLLAGQDMVLVSGEQVPAESIWNNQIGTHRPMANGLLEMMQHVINMQG